MPFENVCKVARSSPILFPLAEMLKNKPMNTKELQITQIESLEQLKSTIENIKIGDVSSKSQALHTTLGLQLKVINLINKSTLVDSSFDLIFTDFKKGLREAIDEEEKELIKDKVQLYIHNYIFFLDAKLCYFIKKDKQNEEELLTEAANLLAENSADLLLLASGLGAPKVVISKLAKEILSKAKDNPGLIKKLMNWIKKEERQKEATLNFIQTIDLLYKKLDYHKNSIGKSDLINGLLTRWSEDVITYRANINKFNIWGLLLGIIFSICTTILFMYFYFDTKFTDFTLLSLSNKLVLTCVFFVLTFIISLLFSKVFNKLSHKSKVDKLIQFYSTN